MTDRTRRPWTPRLGASWGGHTDPKVKTMRRATSAAESRFGNANQPKVKRSRPITLPTLKFMRPEQ